MELLCSTCVRVIKENPGVSPIKLFPKGEPEDAVTIIDGTAYCEGHVPSSTSVSDKEAQQALKEDYERNWSHTHCWDQEDSPACGISFEKHAQCCLCDTQVPRKDSVEEGTV